MGISVTIIFILFVSQHFGTQKIAFLFSPVIILWLTANLGIAIYNLHAYGGEVFNVRRQRRAGTGTQHTARHLWSPSSGLQ